MGKRYYCDYCDRSFKDDGEARKKHLSSLQHVKNRADHYSLFKDPQTILNEEALKTPCKRFMTYGECSFGHSCKFSHYTPNMIHYLQILVAEKHSAMREPYYRPDPNEIKHRFFQNVISEGTSEDTYCPVWDAVPELQNYMNLPPSLWPIMPENVTDSNFAKWGS